MDEDSDPLLEGGELRAARREIREQLGSAVEVTYPVVDLSNATVEHGISILQGATLRERWDVPVEAVLAAVAAHTGLPPVAICSESRVRRLASARRLTVLTGRTVGLTLTGIARVLGVSVQAASQLEQGAQSEDVLEARKLVGLLVGNL